MYIKCWGSRGSTPVSGKNYLKYGGDTTCLEIRTQSNDIIIVDAGTGIRRLGNQLLAEGIFKYHFIFTHAHWDHLMGFPFFKPLYSKNVELQMHRCPFHSKFLETILSKVMAPPNFPVRYSDVKAKITYETACPDTFEIGSITVTPIPLSHPNGGSGYKFSENGKSFVFLTDNELGFIHPGGASIDDYLKFSADAELLIHDGEYTPKEYERRVEWGHSRYTDALDLGIKAGAKQLGLFHINQERFDPEMDMIIEDCKQIIDGGSHKISCFAVGEDMAFTL